MQSKNIGQSKKIDQKTTVIDQKMDIVIDKFDEIQESIKSANPIKNPISSRDFILNAYIYKSSGENAMSIKMFEQYFNKTNVVKYDLYLDFYEVLKAQHSTDIAKSKLMQLNLKELAKAVIIASENTGKDAIIALKKCQISAQLNDYLILIKLCESSTEYLGTSRYSVWLKIIKLRISLGQKFESTSADFFDKNRPLEILKDHSWVSNKNEIIPFPETQKGMIAFHNKTSKEDFWTTMYNLVGKENGITKGDIDAYKTLVNNKTLMNEFRNCP